MVAGAVHADGNFDTASLHSLGGVSNAATATTGMTVVATPLRRQKLHTNAPMGYTYCDDPRRKREEDHSHLYEYNLRSYEQAATQGWVKRLPWDRVRPVTRTYGDFWGQQV